MSSAILPERPARPTVTPPSRRTNATRAATRGRHLAWLAAAIVVSFSVPFVLADQWGLPRDLYYGLYGASVIGLCAGWMRDTGQSLRTMTTRRWRSALGLAAAALCVLLVLGTEDATSHPGGVEFVGAIVWRGLVYGAIDGLLLTAFPILVVLAAFSGSHLRRRRRGRVAMAALALVASLLMTATYHLGYSDFRSEKVRKPMTGDLVWAVPALATANPFGAPVAHAAMHVTAVVHSYDTDRFLPPH